MFKQFFLSELRYNLRQPMVYLFFTIVFLLVFAANSTDNVQIGGAIGNVNRNAPHVITVFTSVMCIFGLLFAVAFFNNAALRDHKYNFQDILFATPLNKFGYFFGRFTAALLLSTIPLLGVFFGIALGSFVAPLAGWIEPDRFGPLELSTFLSNYFIFVLPNMLFAGSIIYLLAQRFRSTIVSFVGALIIIIAYSVSGNYLSDLDNETLGALVDTFGNRTYGIVSKYYTPLEKNTLNPSFSRPLLRLKTQTQLIEAKLLVTLLMSLRGTPYVYQGDEIGMTNVSHPSIDLYDDIETRNAWKAAEAKGKDMAAFLKAVHWQSRDNARTPIQWDATAQAGFTSGKPWIPVNENYPQINVAAAEKDTDSILHYYRKMIAYRKTNLCLVYGHFEDLLPQHPHLYVYKRWDENNTYLVVHNFRDSKTNWEQKEVGYLLETGNYTSHSSQHLSPWESRIYRLV